MSLWSKLTPRLFTYVSTTSILLYFPLFYVLCVLFSPSAISSLPHCSIQAACFRFSNCCSGSLYLFRSLLLYLPSYFSVTHQIHYFFSAWPIPVLPPSIFVVVYFSLCSWRPLLLHYHSLSDIRLMWLAFFISCFLCAFLSVFNIILSFKTPYPDSLFSFFLILLFLLFKLYIQNYQLISTEHFLFWWYGDGLILSSICITRNSEVDVCFLFSGIRKIILKAWDWRKM